VFGVAIDEDHGHLVNSHRRNAARKRNVRSSTARDHRLFGLGAVLAQPLDILVNLFLEAGPTFRAEEAADPALRLCDNLSLIAMIHRASLFQFLRRHTIAEHSRILQPAAPTADLPFSHHSSLSLPSLRNLLGSNEDMCSTSLIFFCCPGPEKEGKLAPGGCGAPVSLSRRLTAEPDDSSAFALCGAPVHCMGPLSRTDIITPPR